MSAETRPPPIRAAFLTLAGERQSQRAAVCGTPAHHFLVSAYRPGWARRRATSAFAKHTRNAFAHPQALAMVARKSEAIGGTAAPTLGHSLAGDWPKVRA